MMSHIFPCNADKNKATNKKYTLNRASKIDILQLGNFLQFFSTNLEKIENIDFYIFPCDSNEN